MIILENSMVQIEQSQKEDLRNPVPIFGSVIQQRIIDYIPFLLSLAPKVRDSYIKHTTFMPEIWSLYNLYYKGTNHDPFLGGAQVLYYGHMTPTFTVNPCAEIPLK